MNDLNSEIDLRDEAVTRRLAALAHPVRLKLLRHLGHSKSCCVKDLVARIGMAQSTVSQHLKVLVDAELVSYRPEQTRSCYTINADAVHSLIGVIEQTLTHCCGGDCGPVQGDDCEDPQRREDALSHPAGYKDI
ncbi:metalloregulator ArsR/SmtB family transcription factor [Hoeflea sp. G2-23]|uniref:Metalloregulator ArsR/SmtB family transcription factor n=1 Tax=Hoeflea algicola TaxID=2983763 RepID=A0ABT3Z765_9HYPH|nr:metalloregulator ArsR/SmtB family transcription factor [Hoeflea algicola]MCY0147595.1 metalloregulator ArsR/SmtB family transcription factor [Hoeflea algicola]